MPAFTFTPSYGAQLSVKPRVVRAQFGDGYSQRVVDGINNKPRKWQLTFAARTTAEIQPILAFLETQGGDQSFDWTPPTGAAGKWIIDDGWTHTLNRFNDNTVSVVFQEVFDL